MVTSKYRLLIKRLQSIEKQGSTSPFSSLNELKPETILISARTQRTTENSTTFPSHKASCQYRRPLTPLAAS
jgi:hypothetical protein